MKLTYKQYLASYFFFCFACGLLSYLLLPWDKSLISNSLLNFTLVVGFSGAIVCTLLLAPFIAVGLKHFD